MQSKISKTKFKYRKCSKFLYLSELSSKYSMPVFDSKDKVKIIDGFWQSPKYFNKYRKDILSFFVPNFKISKKGKQYLSMIENSNSISVHIRRGDYVKIGWCLEDEYYERAINFVETKIKKPRYFVFSDDILWCKNKEFFVGKNVVFVDVKRKKDFEDIWLMSKCMGNIIANSTFSWWGAYLNDKNGIITVAPEKMKSTNNLDFAMEDWILL